jgi:hypothetical protein
MFIVSCCLMWAWASTRGYGVFLWGELELSEVVCQLYVSCAAHNVMVLTSYGSVGVGYCFLLV